MTEETRKPRCAECGHKQESHFCCEVGSFCEECPNDEDNTWEHVFAADAKREEPRMQRQERCGFDTANGLVAYSLPCTLPKGHAGEHSCVIYSTTAVQPAPTAQPGETTQGDSPKSRADDDPSGGAF